MRLVERTIPGTVFAFRFLFGIDSNQAFVGWGYLTFAVDVEKPGRSVLSADILVGHSVRCASTFKRNRIGKVFGLCRRPFCVAQDPLRTAAYNVCCHIHFSAAGGFRQTTPDRLRPVCPSAS
jgi:hypothetical protein